jgi:MFS family permease
MVNQMNTPDSRRWWALALLCGAFFMVVLDATIVLVALPSIQADIGFSEQGLQWVLSAYALTFGGLLVLEGRAADLLGRRRLFTTGVLLFTAASLMCGLAWSPAALLAARVVHGAGAAIMTPTALSIISTTFTEGFERNKALGVWGALGGIGATAAWLIGGPLVDGPGWEWIFFINIPLVLAALALSPRLLRESRAPTARRSYDPVGALSSTGALVLLVYALVEAPDVRWGDVQTILFFAGSAVLLAAFALIESRHRAPLVPLRFLRSRTLVGANAVMLLAGAVAFGLPFVLTLYARRVLGYSAVRFGVSSVAVAVGAIVGQAALLKVGFRPVAAKAWRSWARGRSCHAGLGERQLLRRHLLRAARRRSRDRPRPSWPPRSALAGVAEHESGSPQAPQHRPPDRLRARRRHRLGGCGLPLRGLHGGERRCEHARRAERGLPVRLPGLRRAGRDRRGAGAPAPRPPTESTAGAARGRRGSHPERLTERNQR